MTLDWFRRSSVLMAAAIVTAVAVALAPPSRANSIDPVAVAEVVSDHHAAHAHADHSHSDAELGRHALDHHWAEVLDFENTPAWLPPDAPGSPQIALSLQRAFSAHLLRDGPGQSLERPPRG